MIGRRSAGSLESPTVAASVPYLCLALVEQTDLREGMQLTAATTESSGPPLAYNEVPSSLVRLGADDEAIPLPGRRPIGLRSSKGTGVIEFVDGNRGEIVQIDEGRVTSIQEMGVDSATLVAAVWGGDGWHVLTDDGDGLSVRTFRPTGGLTHVVAAPSSDAGHFRLGASPVGILLVEFESPHRLFVIDPDTRNRWRHLGEVAFLGEAEGRTVPLAPIVFEGMAIVTLVDQGSAARTVRLVDLSNGAFRDSRIELPMAFISVDRDGAIYAIRETGGRQLLRFTWALDSEPCVHS